MIRLVVIPILAPGLVAVALFGFTYPTMSSPALANRGLAQYAASVWTMTLNVTSPSLYALGTVTTIICS